MTTYWRLVLVRCLVILFWVALLASVEGLIGGPR